MIYREIDRTAADLERRKRGDGDRWRALFDQWLQIKDAVLSTLFSPFPPVRGPLQLLRALGTADALRLAHLLLLPADVMAEQLFDGEAARLLLLGNAMHADAPIDAPGSGTVPSRPFMLVGQMTTADPSRSPPGTESAWAYTHLARGMADDASADQLSVAVDLVLEEHAPGFTGHVVGKSIQRPSDLEASDANLHAGAVNGGTSQLFQQLIFRPAPGFGRAETPVQNVYLGSAGATPGGGVHGVCGRNAARAALAGDGARGWPRRRLNRALVSVATR